jgi:hypothetical protein
LSLPSPASDDRVPAPQLSPIGRSKLPAGKGRGDSMFGREHYNARSSELEAAAKAVTNANIKASYLELARRFREMANFASVAGNSSADEVVRLTERIIGKTSGPR